ncbi:hypothetical protein STENM327S_06564 [Streptomyces tendae]
MLLAGALAGSALMAVPGTASAAVGPPPPDTTAPAVVPSGPGMELSAASFTQMTVDDVSRRVWIAGEQDYPDGSRDGELTGVLYASTGARRRRAPTCPPPCPASRWSRTARRSMPGRPTTSRPTPSSSGFLDPLDPIPAPADGCGRELVHTGGRLFFTSRPAA